MKTLNIDFKEGNQQDCPDGHAAGNCDTGKYRFIVYDTSVYTMKQILANFQKTRKPLIGTYNAEKKILITNEKTYTV